MKLKPYLMFALLCAVAQGVWALTPVSVSSEEELTAAIANRADIQLTADIQLSSRLYIVDETVTIDLNGNKLSRSLNDYSINGCVIELGHDGALTLKSSVEGGSIEGGWATFGGGIKVLTGGWLSVNNVTFTNNIASESGGAIFAQSGTNVTLDHTTFTSNSANDHAGAIWNNGTLSATDCTFSNNTASDVGAIYNSVSNDDAGYASLTGCSFTDNKGTTGAGALANALGNTVMFIDDCTISDNIASGHGGGIWNGGTLTVTNSAFTNNVANDVGGIYNAVSTDGTTAGTATLTNCTFTRNRGIAGAGALANAMGATEMNIENCTIENNTAYEYGAGIWNGGTLNMKGVVKVTSNKNSNDAVSNVYLKREKVITLTGYLTGSNIGVDLESVSGTFTRGYNTYHNGVDPSTFFAVDRFNVVGLSRDDNGEVCLVASLFVNYIERSWDATNKQVISTEKTLKGVMIGYDATPVEGQYKEVTSADDDEWYGMGGYGNNVAEYYVVHGNVYRETVVVQGKNVHLILCDDAMLHLTGGLKLEEDNKLYIHCQSYGDKMGKLIVTNRYKHAAGIGSAWENLKDKLVGELVIHGGHIEATGGQYGAGIGSCSRGDHSDDLYRDLCKSITVYGGYVNAIGGENAAGIGGGTSGKYYHSVNGGTFIMYDGTVIAQGGIYAAGLGGGGVDDHNNKNGGYGGDVTVYGGTLTATGGKDAAGIGSGSMETYDASDDYNVTRCGGTFSIYGGTVTANGSSSSAGIGGGARAGGADVYVYGGTVTANAGRNGAGIGGGEKGKGFIFHMSGGMVTANAGSQAAGIGGGYKGKGGDVTITGGTVFAKAGDQGGETHRAIGPGQSDNNYGTLTIGDLMMVGAGDNGTAERIVDADERVNACWYRSYAEISPCTHPGATFTVSGTNADDTHTKHCSHCATAFETENHTFENGTCTICGTELASSFSLADDSDNSETLTAYNGLTVESITLTGRTLYKDGSWNTLCLPFEVIPGEDPLTGYGMVAMTLDTKNCGFSNGTLTLSFSDVAGNPIPAGTPFIVKWPKNTNNPTIVDPTFSNVTISNELNNQVCTINDEMSITFKGTYAPVSFDEEGDNTVLYLGADNTLYYPSGAMTIGAQRAFFQLNGLTAGPASSGSLIKAFNLNFGEETGIEEVNGYGLWVNGYGAGWYSLDGCHLGSKPTDAGLYIHNGVKVLIK